MEPNRWPAVAITLGLLLLAAGVADGYELLTTAPDDDWRFIVRAELEFLGGLWLMCGFRPRWAWRAALGVFAGILLFDIVRAAVGLTPRWIWGRVAVGAWWVLGSDALILLALLRWRPREGRASPIDFHPWRVTRAASLAVAIGLAQAWSQAGYFPKMAQARSDGSPGSAGLRYLVYLPKGYYSSRRPWPLILALHGSGATGSDINRVRREGLPRRVEEKGGLSFVVVAPQDPRGSWDVAALEDLIEDVLKRYWVDADRVYLTGESMGGYGAWALAAANPERFAAIVPICGGGDPASADRLRGVPTWAFHGAEDTLIRPEESRKMVAALQRAGGDARLTIYPGIGHDAYTMTFANPRLYDWFLAHRRAARGANKE